MHAKTKGNIGECAVALDLMKRGYPVFTEMGDLSRVDLITIVDNKIIKIQVKNHNCWGSANQGVIQCSLFKSGPNYKFKYTEKDVDIFAYYVASIDNIVYLNWEDFGDKGVLSVRYIKAKNNNTKFVNWYEDYLDFEEKIMGM